MEAAKPSRTALGVAIRRAAHQFLDSPRILDDPLAMKIVAMSAAEIEEQQAKSNLSRGLRAFVATRSRLAEDTLAKWREAGTRQYVVLGAGLDTFAYRNPFADMQVFEVDHPATQAWKLELLQRASIAIPPSAIHVPVDFEHDSLETQMRAAGFDFKSPPFFSWLGVVPYLTESAFLETLGFIARMPRGSGVLFDYGIPRHQLSEAERAIWDRVASRVASVSEEFKLFFDPIELKALLMRTGFAHIEDLGREELNARYFANRSDGFQLMGSGRIVTASR